MATGRRCGGSFNADDQALVVRRASWCDEAGAALESAARGDLAIIRKQVESGVAILWRLAGKSGGWIVTREHPGELVLVCGAGHGAVAVIDWVTERALAAGLSVRTHIVRRGLQRIYERRGYVVEEIVMRKLSHGQQVE